MKPTIKLSDIVENIEMASDGRYAFYNELTGEFYWRSDFIDCENDDRGLDEEEGWLLLPNQRDTDEYGMMSDFADTVKNSCKRGHLFALRTQCDWKDNASRVCKFGANMVNMIFHAA